MADRKLIVEIIGDSSSLEKSLRRSSSATKQFDRDFSKATRGILSGSGIFRSLGRSLAFASGGFLAFGGAAAFLRKSVDAAKEAQVANAQLATQLTNSGKSFAEYRGQIDQTVSRLSALAGIQDDELKSGLTTILRTVPDVSKALRDLGTATDLARARHISLAQASIIIAKTEAGNTTLLRRQGFQIAKNATAEQALAKVRAVVAGQAAAGTTQQERFGAVLHQTEEIIGTGILPTLNKYLESGTRWLEQMNQSGKLQKDVASAAHDFSEAVKILAGSVKAVDKVTGSFKHTLELLLALKVASTFSKWTKALLEFEFVAAAGSGGGAAGAATTLGKELSRISKIGVLAVGLRFPGLGEGLSKIPLLRGQLTKLALLRGIVIPITIAVTAEEIGNALNENTNFSPGKLLGDLKDLAHGHVAKGPLLNFLLGNGWQSDLQHSAANLSSEFTSDSTIQNVGALTFKNLRQAISDAVDKAAASDSGTGGAGGGLSASQKNTFFDNAISRLLLRGGLGDINGQIAALEKADALIQQRLKVTKDVTRRLNLEDDLLRNQAQIKDLRGQLSADALAKREAAKQAALDALQRKADARAKAAAARAKALAALTSKQFRELGLSATGDEVTPAVTGLKKRLGQLTANITGTNLDTPKLRTELARFRKILSEGLVPKDVRAKIKDMMDEIADQLKNTGQRNASKFRRVNANALLSGLGLDAETTRILRRRLAQVGSNGTVPGGRSAAFAGAGTVSNNQPIVLTLDGKVVSKVVTNHQRRGSQRRSESRRGPYAGRH